MKPSTEPQSVKVNTCWTEDEIVAFISMIEECRTEKIPLTNAFVKIGNLLIHKKVLDIWIFYQYYFTIRTKDTMTVKEIINEWNKWVDSSNFRSISFDVQDITVFDNLFRSESSEKELEHEQSNDIEKEKEQQPEKKEEEKESTESKQSKESEEKSNND